MQNDPITIVAFGSLFYIERHFCRGIGLIWGMQVYGCGVLVQVSFQLVPIGRMLLSQTALVNSYDAGFLIEELIGYIVCN